MFKQGLRISCLQRFVANGQEQFLTVYRPGTGAQELRFTDGAAFVKEATDMFKQGLRISCLQRFILNRHERFLTVYHPGTGAEELRFHDRAAFDGENLKMFNQGLRIACVHATHQVRVEPLECESVRRDKAQTLSQLKIVGKSIQDDLRKGNKPSAEEKKEQLRLQKELSALEAKAAALRCFAD
jgi:hypothetical protein